MTTDHHDDHRRDSARGEAAPSANEILQDPRAASPGRVAGGAIDDFDENDFDDDFDDDFEDEMDDDYEFEHELIDGEVVEDDFDDDLDEEIDDGEEDE